MLRMRLIVGAALASLVLAAPAAAQVMTGATVRGAIIGAVLGGKAGEAIGASMDESVKALKPGLTGAEVQRVGEGIVLRIESRFLFPFASDQILPVGRANLRAIAATLKAHPETDAIIVGHADKSGDAKEAMSLSYRRAEAAKAFLVKEGADSSRFRIEGRGGTEPIANNAEAAGRALNKRLEIGIFAGEAHREAMLKRFGS